MRETVFLKQNAEKWKTFESFVIGKEKANPDALADFFVQLTDDLSYARTFYPKSTTTQYLNALTAKVHQAIYRNKKESTNRFFNYWRVELPLVIKSAHKELLYSLTVFVLAVLIGVVSSVNDHRFVRLILGDSYVNMTLENIKNNDPLAVYKKMNAIDMFLGITVNNIQVAFFAFVMGALLSFGSVWILFRNGVMLGVFHHFFYQHGLLESVLSTVWIHGTLEIAAIIIAGGAGLVIGNSILFPGAYSRKHSFMLGARKGLRIVIGLIPVFILAGFLEGFVTRYTNMPAWLSSTIILSSGLFVFYYFVIYPYGNLRKN